MTPPKAMVLPGTLAPTGMGVLAGWGWGDEVCG